MEQTRDTAARLRHALANLAMALPAGSKGARRPPSHAEIDRMVATYGPSIMRMPALDEQGVRGVALGLLMAEGYLEPARED